MRNVSGNTYCQNGLLPRTTTFGTNVILDRRTANEPRGRVTYRTLNGVSADALNQRGAGYRARFRATAVGKVPPGTTGVVGGKVIHPDGSRTWLGGLYQCR